MSLSGLAGDTTRQLKSRRHISSGSTGSVCLGGENFEETLTRGSLRWTDSDRGNTWTQLSAGAVCCMGQDIVWMLYGQDKLCGVSEGCMRL